MNKKGVAGTNVVIQLMVAIFVIGILGMLIAITGSQMLESSGYDTTSTITVLGEDVGVVGNTSYSRFDVWNYREVACSLVAVYNDTTVVNSANYSTTLCGVRRATETYKGATWTVNYTYTYDAINDAGSVINDTVVSVKDVPDNFSLWLVVGGLVVVIGLIAFVIITLRGTGMMGEDSA